MCDRKQLALCDHAHCNPLPERDEPDAYWIYVEGQVMPFLSQGERHMLFACDLLVCRLVRVDPKARPRDEIMDEILNELHMARESYYQNYRLILQRWWQTLTRDLERARTGRRPSPWQLIAAWMRGS